METPLDIIRTILGGLFDVVTILSTLGGLLLYIVVWQWFAHRQKPSDANKAKPSLVKRTVLLANEDATPAHPYILALEQNGYEVKQSHNADDTLELATQEHLNIAVIIHGILLKPGGQYPSETTHGGLRTGIPLSKDLSERYPYIPIIILTQVADAETLNQFPEEDRLKVVQALEYPPIELAQLVKEMGEHTNENASVGENGGLPDGR